MQKLLVLRSSLRKNMGRKLVFSLLFSVIWCLCDAYRIYDTYRGLTLRPLWYSGCFIFTSIVCFALLTSLDIFLTTGDIPSAQNVKPYLRHMRRIADQRLFLIAFLGCLIAWLPFLIAFFPGSMTFDATRQLQAFTGIIEWTTHHPVFPTLIMGSITYLGNVLFHSDTLALAFYVLLYTLFQAFTCALIVQESYRVGQRLRYPLVALLFFMVVPLFGANAQTIWKDTLYMCFFAYFFIGLTRLAYQNPSSTTSHIPSYAMCVLGGLCATLCRKETIYIVCVTLCVLIITKALKKPSDLSSHPNAQRKTGLHGLAITSILIVVPYVLVTYVAIPRAGIANGSPVEAAALPMQQLARFAKYHPDELSEQDCAAYNKFWKGGGPAVAELYVPSFADPVKNAFDAQELDALAAYYPYWVLRHPLQSLESAWATTYGYLYVGPSVGAPPVMVLFYDDTLEQVYEYTYIPALQSLRDILTGWCSLWSDVPVLQWFVLPGFYTWFYLALLFSTVRQERHFMQLLILFAPIFLTVMAACLSPVDGYLRYIFGIVLVLPLTLSYCAAGNVTC